jgi:hypothetical protein
MFCRHCAIVDYLQSAGFAAAAAEARAAFRIEPDADVTSGGTASGALDRKWTSVLRLNKKISDLEAHLLALKEEVAGGEKAARGITVGACRLAASCRSGVS